MRSPHIFRSYVSEIRARLSHATNHQRTALVAAGILLFVGAIGSIGALLSLGSLTVPARGGTLSTGITGSVRFINPVLATSDTDKDIASLVFSGLMRRDQNGMIVPDLAESYSVSPDGRTYTFIIKKGASFHDGKPVTADDIVFTIAKAQDATIKSPWLVSWIDVSADRIDDRTVSFTIKEPYAGFLLATTIGILPQHRWVPDGDADAFEFNPENTRPVGSGPYRVKRVHLTDGRPTVYDLVRVGAADPSPWINRIEIRMFANEAATIDALTRGSIDMVGGIKPASATEINARRIAIESEPLPRVFALFLNGTQEKAFSDSAVRQAINKGLDRQALVDQTLGGFGTATDKLLPLFTNEEEVKPTADIAAANRLLDSAGWKRSGDTGVRSKSIGGQTVPLSFAIATANTPELADAARLIAEQLTPLGFEVTVQVYDLGTLDRDLIRPRTYDALLFGHVYRHDSDAYAFWHSSQRADPGLNIARYADPRVDQALERAFASNDESIRDAAYATIESRLAVDLPAVALYQPNHISALRSKLQGRAPRALLIPSDTFADIASWYVRSDVRWPLFIPKPKVSQ
jgi:peptide/nickel transport system substrate-binding protein